MAGDPVDGRVERRRRIDPTCYAHRRTARLGRVRRGAGEASRAQAAGSGARAAAKEIRGRGGVRLARRLARGPQLKWTRIEKCVCPLFREGVGPGGFANHIYFWDTRNDHICGRGTDSKAGHENPIASGTHCVGILGSSDAGRADGIMKCCKDLNNSIVTSPIFFLPPLWDCHNFVNHCVLKVGLTPPKHPGGRLGARCPEPTCQPGPWGGPPSGPYGVAPPPEAF